MNINSDPYAVRKRQEAEFRFNAAIDRLIREFREEHGITNTPKTYKEATDDDLLKLNGEKFTESDAVMYSAETNEYTAVCKMCGKTFSGKLTGRGGMQKYCSDECRKKKNREYCAKYQARKKGEIK